MGHHKLRKGKETSNIVCPDLELNLSWKPTISNCYKKDYTSASKRQDSLYKHIALAAGSQYVHCILHLSSMKCQDRGEKVQAYCGSPVWDTISQNDKEIWKGEKGRSVLYTNIKFLRALRKKKTQIRKREIVNHLPLDCPGLPGGICTGREPVGVSQGRLLKHSDTYIWVQRSGPGTDGSK